MTEIQQFIFTYETHILYRKLDYGVRDYCILQTLVGIGYNRAVFPQQ